MNKTEKHKNDLIDIFSSFIDNGDEKELIKYLLDNSNLPGRRANLELGKAFVDIIEGLLEEFSDQVWILLEKLLKYTPDKAPTNNPLEFLPFCATWALGIFGIKSKQNYRNSISKIKSLANDSRWRMREAVAKAIHIMLERNEFELINELEKWIEEEEWLLMRAVATGLASPRILKKKAQKALRLHELIFNQIIRTSPQKNEEFMVLRKGLGYSLSVVVQAIPEDGFKFMDQFTRSENKNIIWILKQNLKKNRLIKNHPLEVKSTLKKLN